jgi:alpha-N-arabinofuranosidase
MYINVVNRHEQNAIATDIVSYSAEFAGKADIYLIASHLKDPFTFDKQEQYKPVVKEIKTEKNKFTFSFPAHSFTQIKIGVNK